MSSGDSLELFPRDAGDAADARAGRGASSSPFAPLAERMRPRALGELVGQAHLVAPGAALSALAGRSRLPSMILWGPPGTGKTTLARLLADASGARFHAASAVTVGVKEVREIVEQAARTQASGVATVLFLDEIHRFNRAQQDVLLPHVESGRITLIGATTENPSFEVNAALLSRARVFVLRPLSGADIATLLARALTDAERGLGASGLGLDADALDALASLADGDARRALGLLDAAADLARARDAAVATITLDVVAEAAGARTLRHDRDRDAHYDTISAFIKSLRASDPDAAIYWMARLIEAGDDPLFVARRLVIFASEDIGNADPHALPLALAAFDAVDRVGLPEGRIPLAQATTYLACAPKSNAAWLAGERAAAIVREHGSLPVPLHLRNATTALLRAQGYGSGYVYAHDAPDAFVSARNLPDALGNACFYEPKDSGDETVIRERLAAWRARRETS